MGYALARMDFDQDTLDLLERTMEVDIETVAPDGPPHRATIWIVTDGGDAFIRTWKGPKTRWYREALANPAVAIHVEGQRLTATVVPATDPASIERASAGYRRKHAGDPATDAMVSDEVLETTLRVVPA